MRKCQAKKKPCRSPKCPDKRSSLVVAPHVIKSSEKTNATKNPKAKKSNRKKSQAKVSNTSATNKAGAAAEKRGLEYIKNFLPKTWEITATGKYSNKSDLEITDASGNLKGFVEVKQLPSAAGGQIVIEISGNVITSSNLNQYTPDVLDLLPNLENLKNNEIKIPLNSKTSEAVWNWMLTHWENKKVMAFYLTDKLNTYEKFVEVKHIKDETQVELSVRRKQSGPSPLPKKSYDAAKKYFSAFPRKDKLAIIERDGKIFVKTKVPLEKEEQYHTLGADSIFLSPVENPKGQYEIKKRATTNNPTVLMSLILSGKSESTPKNKTKEFFDAIS